MKDRIIVGPADPKGDYIKIAAWDIQTAQHPAENWKSWIAK